LALRRLREPPRYTTFMTYLPLAGQATIIVYDTAGAFIEMFQAGVAPAAVSLLTSCLQAITIHANVLAGTLVIASGKSAFPSAIVPIASCVTLSCIAATAEIAIVVDNLSATVAIIDGSIMPSAVFCLATGFNSIPVDAHVSAGLFVITRRQIALSAQN
jgi:hypothetical protein